MSLESRDRLVVRSYELDSYGHVNNAVFAQWFEHGRCHLLQERELDYHRIEERWGVRFVTVSSRIDYRAQLGLADVVLLTTGIARFGRSSVTFAHRLERAEPGVSDVVAEGEAVLVFTDPEMRGSVPIPDEFRELFA